MDLKLRPLTIFEGPDCGGKSTAANKYRTRRVDSSLTHHGPYKGIDKSQLPRFYVETMMPMLLGHAEQIWDRCWLSEPIYGRAFRNGEDRVGVVNRRHLERFALRHGAVVVLCLPPWENVQEEFLKRKGDEYLDNVDQLRQVYDDYVKLKAATHLPVVCYDYTRHGEDTLWNEIERVRPRVHKYLYSRMGGNYNAPVVLVGDKASDPTSSDTVFQIPFASFSGSGSSAWLTSELERFGIREDQLLWLNSEDGVQTLKERHLNCVIALGAEADAKLTNSDIPHFTVNHPQYHKRFKSADLYPLLDLIDQHL